MKLLEVKELGNQKTYFSKIKQECSEFINNSLPIFRGTTYRGSVIKLDIRTDRRPKDLTTFDTAVLNVMYNITTGGNFVRNTSLFATHDKHLTEAFGEYTYYVFPINNSKVYYIDGVEDIAGMFSLGDDMADITLRNQVTQFLSSIPQFPQQYIDKVTEEVIDMLYNSPLKVTTLEQLSHDIDHVLHEAIKEVLPLQEIKYSLPTHIAEKTIKVLLENLSPHVTSTTGLDSLHDVHKKYPELCIVAPYAYMVCYDDFPVYVDLIKEIRNSR